jgi:tetratricopeptide (TPR) repeat protein
VADVVLAQALYLRGQRAESERIVRALPQDLPPSASLYEQLGLLAGAQDRHLRSIEWYEQALNLGAANPGELRYWEGISALGRGDYGRALSFLESARAEDAVPPLEEQARRDGLRATAPSLVFPFRMADDSNELSNRQTGVGFSAWPGRAFPITVEAVTGTLEQRGLSYDRTRTTGSVSRALVTPQLGLHGFLGTEQYNGPDRRVMGGGGATYYFADRSTLGIDLRRDTIWAERDGRDPRQDARSVDLSRLGPNFMVNAAEVTLGKTLGQGQEVRVQASGRSYQDDNHQATLYGHYQFALSDRPGSWAAIGPSVYWETFSRRSPAYFSSDGYVALGGMWHSILRSSVWRFEAELDPHATWLDGSWSYGAHGVVDVSRTFGPVSAGMGLFSHYDRRTDYWSWSAAAQLGLRLSR